ncbi:MAG: hypothetical protein ACLQVJ_27980 [Syntrophobacteraceae bacterium]
MEKERKQSILKFIKINAAIILYLVMFLLVLVYSDPEIQPFVYVRF